MTFFEAIEAAAKHGKKIKIYHSEDYEGYYIFYKDGTWYNNDIGFDRTYEIGFYPDEDFELCDDNEHEEDKKRKDENEFTFLEAIEAAMKGKIIRDRGWLKGEYAFYKDGKWYKAFCFGAYYEVPFFRLNSKYEIYEANAKEETKNDVPGSN